MSFTRTLGTVVAERLLDVVTLAVLLIISGVLAFHGDVPAALRWWFVAGAALAVVGIATLISQMTIGATMDRLLPGRLRPHAARMRQGLIGSFRREQLPNACGLTLAIWGLEGVRLYCVAHALGVALTPAQSLLVALLASLLTALPLTPAGLGAVEGGIIVALKLFDISATNAGAVALVDRGIAYWSVLLVGGGVWLTQRRRSQHAALNAERAVARRNVTTEAAEHGALLLEPGMVSDV